MKRALLRIRDKLHTREGADKNSIAIFCTVAIQKSCHSSTFHSPSAHLKKTLRIQNFYNCSYHTQSHGEKVFCNEGVDINHIQQTVSKFRRKNFWPFIFSDMLKDAGHVYTS